MTLNQNMLEAPTDGSPFKAVLTDGEEVTVRYSTESKYWVNEDIWYDDEGDGAPDGSCRTWVLEDFEGWIE